MIARREIRTNLKTKIMCLTIGETEDGGSVRGAVQTACGGLAAARAAPGT